MLLEKHVKLFGINSPKKIGKYLCNAFFLLNVTCELYFLLVFIRGYISNSHSDDHCITIYYWGCWLDYHLEFNFYFKFGMVGTKIVWPNNLN